MRTIAGLVLTALIVGGLTLPLWAGEREGADRPVEKDRADKPQYEKERADKPQYDKERADKPQADKPRAEKPAVERGQQVQKVRFVRLSEKKIGEREMVVAIVKPLTGGAEASLVVPAKGELRDRLRTLKAGDEIAVKFAREANQSWLLGFEPAAKEGDRPDLKREGEKPDIKREGDKPDVKREGGDDKAEQAPITREQYERMMTRMEILLERLEKLEAEIKEIKARQAR